MGHVRLGRLPKTRTWQQVVDLIVDGADVGKVADATTRAAEKALSTVRRDDGFRQAVYILFQLGIAASKPNPEDYASSLGIFIPEDALLPDIAAALSDAMDRKLDVS